jgi:small subunit ribosomal protein S8
MSTTDPIADMLTRIRNAVSVRDDYVFIPSSRLKRAIAQVLKDEGLISRFELTRDRRLPMLKVYLKYAERKQPILRGLKRVSKPGCRVYTKKDNIPWVQSGMGVVILSTPRGVISGAQARRLGIGGEVLCEVW